MAILLPQRFAVPLTHGDVWSCPGSGGEQRNFKRPFAIATPAPRRAPRSRPRRPKSSAPHERDRIPIWSSPYDPAPENTVEGNLKTRNKTRPKCVQREPVISAISFF